MIRIPSCAVRRSPARFSSALLLALAAGTPALASPEVTWRSAPQAAARPALAPLAEFDRLAGSGERFIATFNAPLTRTQRDELAASGITILSPLGGGSYFARSSARADMLRAAAAAPIAGATQLAPFHKLEQRFLDNDPPAHARIPAEMTNVRADEVVAAYVVLHADVEITADATHRMIENVGGVVRDIVPSANTLVVELPLASVKALARLDDVQWVEPPLPRLSETNASNRAITQADQAQSAPYNLDGSGVTVLVYDGGTARATHNDFSGRMTVIDGSGLSSHATHTSGTVGGDGSVIANHRGMAPNVSLISAGFEYDGSGIFLYTNPGDIDADYATAISMGANISNNSIGSNIGPNGFPCSSEGDYSVCAAAIDNIIRGSAGGPITVFWSAGNERGSGCGSMYNTSPPPTNNKNAITVGALNSNNDSVTSFTSWGPSDDGRLRPVISGPGCQSSADGGVTSTTAGSDTEYGVSCGTSMSGPTLAGLGALVLQDYRANFAGPDPTNAMMKAWFCHNAADIVTPGPDYQTGYGSARVVDTIDHVRAGNWEYGNLDHEDVTLYTVNVAGGTGELKLTMAWDDVAGTPNVVGSLVNDLDLHVVAPDGTRHFPWTLDPADPDAGASQDREDHLNNIEQVQVTNPMPGAWRVAVVGSSVASGPQEFAITSSHPLNPGAIWIGEDKDLAVPTEVMPGQTVNVRALAAEGTDSIVPGSITLHHRFDGGAFTAQQAVVSADGYEGFIPGAPCGSTIEYYWSAQGAATGVITHGPGDDGMRTIAVGETVTTFLDNLESSAGWTVSGGITSQSSGRWEHGVPAGNGDRGDPATDADGSGRCFLTGNGGPGSNTDVDTSDTVLTSPDIDTTAAADPHISYQRWFDNAFGASPNTDPFTVEISNNGGATWVPLETVGPAGGNTFGRWVTASFRVADYVTPTNQVRLRFTASDFGDGAVVEAAIDDIRVTDFQCVQTSCSFADCDANGTINIDDIDCYVAAFLAADLAGADCDSNGTINIDDIDCFVASFLAGCP
ncbi:MAG: S8 family serine peptidase [Phycisphaerales bacterium]